MIGAIYARRLCVAFSVAILAGCSDTARTDVDKSAVAVVARDLGSNKLGITDAQLLTKPNPRGQGTFVYHPTTRFAGVERYLVWLVLNGRAYALNGATKDVTPRLPWPREADDAAWSTTGLNKYGATDAIGAVFGEGSK